MNNENFQQIDGLKKIAQTHRIWQNPLLNAIRANRLSIEDYRLFFSQYYYYSKNFTRLLAVGMYKCESDYFRAKLSENLWEEGGGIDIELRHSQIFRKFLTESLGIDSEKIAFESYSKNFFKDYLSLCSSAEIVECAAILSYGTEGIVAQLYTIIKSGLLGVGLSEKDIHFFNLHIECDDDHALTLEKLSFSLRDEANWYERSTKAVEKILDLRNDFFEKIYNDIQFKKISPLLKEITTVIETNISPDEVPALHYKIDGIKNKLYSNVDLEKKINFYVDRVPFNASVLDPRIVHIPVGFNNELHRHAHETVFYFLSGSGEVILDENIVNVQAGDLVYVPRWSIHQTKNTGATEMVILAITDFGLTARTATNSESNYRMK
jgi:mannose-6-phosphate isomerase-like protein (cupin superfamily)/pyrroloquinoline quinone (PQQ) biosynthesis protein C